LNTEEYISSGILESYVLGITSEQENREVEQLAMQHAEIKSEIEAIRNAMEVYTMKHAIAPPLHVKERNYAQERK